MAGFDSTDPLRDAPLGYRAEIMQSEVASYNGFEFPPTLHSQITVVPEYNESGTSLKYLTVAISIEFIATDPATGVDAYSEYDPETVAGSMNTFMRSLIKRLTYPCQELRFRARGFGDFAINTPGGTQDVDYGPKPQVLEWEPLGGSQAARVQWLCTTRIPHDMVNVSGKLISFEYSMNWGIDPSGFMFRSIEGNAEIPLTRQALAGSDHSSHNFPFPITQFKNIQKKILQAWPQPSWARRQLFFKWDKSHKKVQFKIEDIEIRSSSPFIPVISDIDLSQNISSSMEDGAFLKWKLAYTGRIEVVKGNRKLGAGIADNKKLAWVWLGKIIQEKRKQFEEVAKIASIPYDSANDKRGLVGQATYESIETQMNQSDLQNNGAAIYPTYISITDDIYNNTLNFTIAYVCVITTDLLGQAIGLFDVVRPEGLKDDTWVKYIQDTLTMEIADQHIFPKNEMIVDLCHTVTTPSSPGDTQTSNKKSTKKGDPLFYASSPEPGKDWKKYDNTFIFYDESMSVIGKKLHNQPDVTTDLWPVEGGQRLPLDGTQDAKGNILRKGETDNTPSDAVYQYPAFSAGQPDPENMLKVYAPTQRTIYVRMTGYAERYNAKINTPKLIGVGGGINVDANGKAFIEDNSRGGALAHKIDSDVIARGTKNTGIRDQEGKAVVLYWCSWDKMYVLDRVPVSGRVITTGIPHKFQINPKA
jgi:hypothetical protein